MVEYIILGCLVLAAIIYVVYYLLKLEDRRIEEEKRRKEEKIRLKKEYEKNLDRLRRSIREPLIHLEKYKLHKEKFLNPNLYIAQYDLFLFKSQYNSLYDTLSHFDLKNIPELKNEALLIDTFLKGYNVLNDVVLIKNELFVKKELEVSDELLSNIESKSLDEQQRKAILYDEDNSLVIAGAGSGKTTTIAGKVKYLTHHLGINSDEILLISFTRKSADEMAERIRNKMDISIQVKTFHKLGLEIIAESTNEKPSIFSLSQKEILELLSSFIVNEKSNSEYSENLLNFLSYHLKPYKGIDDFESDSEHNNYLKEQKFEGYKIVHKTTKNGIQIKYRERFKSQEEVLIANFLFRNNIEYIYEDSYKYKTASKQFGQYKPDFYLPDYDIYIEHFGIDENGQVPNWFKGDNLRSAQEKYTEGIAWKRTEHKNNDTTLVETFSWEQSKGVLLIKLKEKLETQGVAFNPMSDEELWDYIETHTPEDIDVFTRLVKSFLTLFKSNNERVKHLVNRASVNDDKRALIFLNLFEKILKSYESYLDEQDEIDFSDMINLASNHIEIGNYRSRYKYIIIDEFQDISKSRYSLIKNLMYQKPSTKLFCVGDDWQSIYRFAGSDIGVFTGFEEYFKTSKIVGFQRNTKVSYIENTYRFSEKMINESSAFILKNPNQISKTLKSVNKATTKPIVIERYSDPNRKQEGSYRAFNRCLENISEVEGDNTTSILCLGRYDFDKKILEQSSIITKNYNRTSRKYEFQVEDKPNLKLDFLTVHSSKGLEADYVIILNGNSGTYGFPSEVSDDPLLNFLLSTSDQFPNGEERRLFYVALTRAKKQVHIIVSEEFPSKFLKELEDFEEKPTLRCEWCDNGILIERNGAYGYFYACDNNHYCNFTRKITATDFFNISKEYLKKGDRDNEKLFLEKCLDIDENHFKALHNLGNYVGEIEENLEKAIELYTKSLNFSTLPSRTHWNRANTYFLLKNFKKAIIDFNLYFAKRKDDHLKTEFHARLAKCYYYENDYENALIQIKKERIITSNPKALIKVEEDIIERKRKTKLEKSKQKDLIVNQSKSENQIILSIQEAIKDNVNIRFNYHKSVQFDGGVKSTRTIRPLEFKKVGNSHCISGHCYLRNAERTFNLDRISSLIINPSVI